MHRMSIDLLYNDAGMNIDVIIDPISHSFNVSWKYVYHIWALHIAISRYLQSLEMLRLEFGIGWFEPSFVANR